jgi:hypothetical protein
MLGVTDAMATKPKPQAKRIRKPKAGVPAPPRTAEEEALIAASADARRRGVRFEQRGKDGIEIQGDGRVALAKLGNVFHTHSPGHITVLLQCSNLMGSTSKATNAEAAVSFVEGIAPQDHLEAVLACQMAAVHGTAVEMLERATLSDQPTTTVDSCITRATRLLRTFTEQVRTLKEYRTKGVQKVIVQHVHITEGGQAIVGGQVDLTRRGGLGEGGT